MKTTLQFNAGRFVESPDFDALDRIEAEFNPELRRAIRIADERANRKPELEACGSASVRIELTNLGACAHWEKLPIN